MGRLCNKFDEPVQAEASSQPEPNRWLHPSRPRFEFGWALAAGSGDWKLTGGIAPGVLNLHAIEEES